MRLRVLFIPIMLCNIVGAANYYVTTNGNDAADGSVGTPWLTIQRGITNTTAGDTLNVGPGLFNEFINGRNNGTAGNPVMIQGTRGGSGEWLTIIDPSTPATNGWVADATIGSGVYTQSFAFEAKELVINTQRVAWVRDLGDMTTLINLCYDTSGLTTGTQLLTLASNAQLVVKSTGGTINFWDALGALYASTNGITYLRLRSGADPNGMDIRVGKNDNASWANTITYPAIQITKSYNTLRNFLIRGSITGLIMRYNTAHHNLIESNWFSGGVNRIFLSSSTSNNVIRYNEIHTDFYGGQGGAWDQGTNSTAFNNEHRYVYDKQIMGGGTSFDNGVYINTCGNSNVVYGNHISSATGNGMLVLGAVATPLTGIEIYSNTVEKCSSVGLLLEEGETGTLVHDNLFSDSNANIRLHRLDAPSETDRTLYIYRNKLWLPENVGEQFFTYLDDGGAVTYHPTIWIYHNSLSGGFWHMAYSSFSDDIGGHTNLFMINNIMSGGLYFNGLYLDSFQTNAAMVGGFDYNYIPSTKSSYYSPDPVWLLAHNVKGVASEWATNNTTMTITAVSPAKGMALNTAQAFTINGRNFSALPQTSATKHGVSWDGGYWERPINRITTLVISGP